MDRRRFAGLVVLSGEEKEKERVSELLVSSSSGRSGRSGRSSFFFLLLGLVAADGAVELPACES